MKPLVRLLAAALILLPYTASAAADRFGVTELYPTGSRNKEWFNKWDNGVARTFRSGQDDPQDNWFHGKGNATYSIDGKGVFTISGATPRMYVIDPGQTSWHDVELTVYAMRIADSGTPWGGIEGVARTNHTADTSNYCDTRGNDARFRYDGHIDFEKETHHPASVAVQNKAFFSGGLPKNKWIGYKLVVYDLPNGNVKLESYMDQTDGLNGGTWVKVNELEDNGSNFGVGGQPCKSGINPAMRLTDSDSRQGSETGKPNLSVYWRSDNVATNGLKYKKMSVREIAAGASAGGGAGGSTGGATGGGTGGTTGGGTGGASTGPVAANIKAANITNTGATIGWTTDTVSHSQVEYGKTTAYGTLSYQSSATGTTHQISLTGLTAGTLYHYRVKSKDDATGLTGVSGDNTFTTTGGAAPAGPVAGAVAATNITDTGATIGWTTDKTSRSQVEYGPTAAYGAKTYQSSAVGTLHQVPVSGLKAGTLYHYRVLSKDDATGLTGVSGDYTFMTTGGAAASSVISNVHVTGLTTSGATVVWNTTTNSHSQVEYGTTTGYGSLSYLSTATGTLHQVPLTGLRSKTTYHYRVRSLDSATGQTAISGDATFTTL
jgi:hypothetical protein